jgi:hypothetical protein
MFSRRGRSGSGSGSNGRREKLRAFLEEAASHLGYRSQAGRVSYYGERSGYSGQPWSGSFIDYVAKVTDVDIPSCVYTPAAAANFLRTGRLYVNPKPGDVVFFNFSTGAHFEMPHVGIVTDVTGVTFNGSFKTIEANVDTGLLKGPQDRNGIFERTRYLTDVLGFGRPDFSRNRLKDPEGEIRQPPVNLSRVLSLKPCRDVELIQLALAQEVGLRNAKRGTYDAQTRSAFANFQRKIGYVGDDATGLPDQNSLLALSAKTKLFSVLT